MAHRHHSGIAPFQLQLPNLQSNLPSDSTPTQRMSQRHCCRHQTATLAPTPTPTPEARIEAADLALLQGETERARTEYRSGSAGTQDIEIQAAAPGCWTLLSAGEVDLAVIL
jgi:hypothetical protein